jgi:hypothetical protein
MTQAEAREMWREKLEREARCYPDTDLAQFIKAQIKKGILVVRDGQGWAAVMYGDRFDKQRKHVSILRDTGWHDYVSKYWLEFVIGSPRDIYWPPGVRVGGRTQRMFRHLERRWNSGW